MIKTLAILLVATATLPPLSVAQPQMQIAEAGVQEPVEVQEEQPEVEPVEEDATFEADMQLSEEDATFEAQEMPTPADEFEFTQSSWVPLGVHHVTHYSAEECGNSIGAAEVDGGLVEGLSIAMPEAWLLGHTVYVEYYGFFRVDDISPDGIADIFHNSEADAIGEDWQEVYLVE